MIADFPKLQSPFVRERGVVLPQIAEGYEWVFTDPEVKAVDKVDGTNVSLVIENGFVARVFNRTSEKPVLHTRYGNRWEGAALEGLGAAISRGWLKNVPDGQLFGELIGPIINGNRHQLKSHIFVPFAVLQARCFWISWSQNKYPKTFDAISEWFRDLPCLFNRRFDFPEIQSEGLVFTRPDGRMAKLRRDMFDWYKGAKHKESADAGIAS